MSIEREFDFCGEKGDLHKLQALMLSCSDAYAKYELQKVLDMLRWATWHYDGIFACGQFSGVTIPYAGIDYVKRYIDKFASDILEEREQRRECGLVKTIYYLKNNHGILFAVTDEPAYGNIHLKITIIDVKTAEKNLVPYVKVVALQEIMGLTKDQVINKYNGRYQGRDGGRIDRWCEPDNMLLFRGFGFNLVCNDRGSIIDLHEVIL